MHCQHLQRLSIKGATWILSNCFGRQSQAEPIDQEMLVNMVRHLPERRWLQSDLSDENVAMLKQERPEVTFVTE